MGRIFKFLNGQKVEIVNPFDPAVQKLVPNSVFARMMGVTPRTLANWEKRGVISPAEKINNRKYWDPATRPKNDEADPGNP